MGESCFDRLRVVHAVHGTFWCTAARSSIPSAASGSSENCGHVAETHLRSPDMA